MTGCKLDGDPYDTIRRFSHQLLGHGTKCTKETLSVARVEQWHQLTSLRIDAGDVWSFVMIAVAARQGEIFRFAVATMLSGNYMLDVEADVTG
jgi:hypothetical protein